MRVEPRSIMLRLLSKPRQETELFYDTGNVVPYIIKVFGGMRARAKRKHVTGDKNIQWILQV